MRQDDDRYLDEDDNDLWDDELDLNSDYQPGETVYNDIDEYDGMAPSNRHMPSESVEDTDDSPDTDESPDNEDDDYYSDPEPKAPVRSRRERLFGRKAEEEEEEGPDYYDSDAEPTPIPPKPKPPKLDPEDPDYWIEEEESPLTEIITRPRKRWKWMLGAAIALVIAILGVWIWMFRPYTDSAVKYGYIKNMERRGSIIKTFEGSMIPYKELGDPDPLYFQEMRFSVKNDSLAAVMKKMMLGCVPVRVEYELYHVALPWKGEEKMIVVRADTADPRKILPPEYRSKD